MFVGLGPRLVVLCGFRVFFFKKLCLFCIFNIFVHIVSIKISNFFLVENVLTLFINVSGTITQLFGASEGECSVIMLATYSCAAFSLTLWSTFFMWLVL
jgi:hypothetical protein